MPVSIIKPQYLTVLIDELKSQIPKLLKHNLLLIIKHSYLSIVLIFVLNEFSPIKNISYIIS